MSYADIGDTIAGAMADPAVQRHHTRYGFAGWRGRRPVRSRRPDQGSASGTREAALGRRERKRAVGSLCHRQCRRSHLCHPDRRNWLDRCRGAHVDESGADAKAGLSWSFVFAGTARSMGTPTAHCRNAPAPTFRSTSTVSMLILCPRCCNRGLTPEGVRATEAAIFRGDLAVRARLADHIGTLDTALADMTAEFEQPLAARHSSIKPTPKRSPSMATEDTEQIETAPPEPAVGPTVPRPAVAPARPVPPRRTPITVPTRPKHSAPNMPRSQALRHRPEGSVSPSMPRTPCRRASGRMHSAARFSMHWPPGARPTA